MEGAVVLQALTSACSQDPSLLKTAEEQLKCLETRPGFYNVLLVCILVEILDIQNVT